MSQQFIFIACINQPIYVYVVYHMYLNTHKLHSFEPVPSSQTHHIIWNVLLADKLMPLTPETLLADNICHIISILPHESDFLKLNQHIPECPYTVLAYGDQHIPTIDKQAFYECGTFIDSLAKSKNRKNVLVFCNNGYQRSVPFLVYYLTTFHPDEVPTVERALSIILSQLDKEHYSELMPTMIENMTKLLG
jgi:hypothetical protein